MSQPSDNLYVSDLPAGIDEDQLRSVFSGYGTVKQCRLVQNGGAAIVRLDSADEAKWVIKNLNGAIPQGLTSAVKVKYANSYNNQEGGWGGSWKGGCNSGGGKGSWGKGDWNAWNQSLSHIVQMTKGFGKGYGKQALWTPKDARGLVRDLVTGGQLPGGRKWENDENTLFVGGLPEDMTDLEMYVIFSTFGAIAPRGASARCDKETGKCTGIGFVNFLESSSAASAIRTLNNTIMADGSMLTVKKKGPAKPKGEGKGIENVREAL